MNRVPFRPERPSFTPAWWLRNPHIQTIWPRLARPRQCAAFHREALTTPDGDELILDHLDVDPGRPRVVLLHGLEGSSNSVYIQGLSTRFAEHRVNVTAMNFRSCARDPRDLRRMIPNRRPRFYHSGETGDFDFVIRTLAQRHPGTTLYAAGASLGGNVLLKWLGENRGQSLVTAAAVLSVPYDLGAGSRHLESRTGTLYVSSFLKTLRAKVETVVERFPEIRGKVDVDRARLSRTFREFDDAATAPLHGFRDAEDYYGQSSSLRWLNRIDTPVLAISAVDDPFLPPRILHEVRDAAPAGFELIVTEGGGHVGFVDGIGPWNCRYWAEETLVEWLLKS